MPYRHEEAHWIRRRDELLATGVAEPFVHEAAIRVLAGRAGRRAGSAVRLFLFLLVGLGLALPTGDREKQTFLGLLFAGAPPGLHAAAWLARRQVRRRAERELAGLAALPLVAQIDWLESGKRRFALAARRLARSSTVFYLASWSVWPITWTAYGSLVAALTHGGQDITFESSPALLYAIPVCLPTLLAGRWIADRWLRRESAGLLWLAVFVTVAVVPVLAFDREALFLVVPYVAVCWVANLFTCRRLQREEAELQLHYFAEP